MVLSIGTLAYINEHKRTSSHEGKRFRENAKALLSYCTTDGYFRISLQRMKSFRSLYSS